MSFKNPSGERGEVCSRRQRRGCKQLLPLRAESPFCTTFEGCQQGVTTFFWGRAAPQPPPASARIPLKSPGCPRVAPRCGSPTSAAGRGDEEAMSTLGRDLSL